MSGSRSDGATRWIAAATLALALPTFPAYAQIATATSVDSDRLAKAREVIDLTMPPDQREAMFEATLNAFMGNMLAGMMQGEEQLQALLETNPDVRAAFNRFVERQRTLVLDDLKSTTPELITAFANAYARAFTVSELSEIAAFLATPTGKRYALQSPTLFSDPDVAAWQRHVTEIAQRRQSGEVAKFLEELAPIIEKQESSTRDS